MGCGASSNTVAIEPVETSEVHQRGQSARSTEKGQDVRTSSGKSRDSGFGDQNYSGNQNQNPQSKSVGFKGTAPLAGKVQADEDEAEVLRKLRSEGLIQRSMTKTNFGVSFEVVEDNWEGKSRPNRPPARLARLQRTTETKKSLTDEEIQAKLKKAQRRKKAQEVNRMSRIQSLTREKTLIETEKVKIIRSELHDFNLQNDNNTKYTSTINPRPLPSLNKENHENEDSRLNIPTTNHSKYSNGSLRSERMVSPFPYDSNSPAVLNSTRDFDTTQEMRTTNQYNRNISDLSADYKNEASKQFSTMLTGAEKKATNFEDEEKYNFRNSPESFSGRRCPGRSSLGSMGAGSKWLKQENKNEDKNDVGRSNDARNTQRVKFYDDDDDDVYEIGKRKGKPPSRLSTASFKTEDSEDFWNE